MQIEIQEQQIKNLLLLLGRVQLSGNEVPAFNEVVALLNKSLEPKKEVKEDKKK